MKLYDKHGKEMWLTTRKSIRYCSNCREHTIWTFDKKKREHSFCTYCRQTRKEYG